MRAAVLFGLGSYEKQFKLFQKESHVTWLRGMPVSSTDADAILIFGGDGTVHRHLSELVELEIPVLVVPCGSGNDFARALKIRNARDAARAWKSFAADRKAQVIDLGVITPQGLKASGQNGCSDETVPFPPMPS